MGTASWAVNPPKSNEYAAVTTKIVAKSNRRGAEKRSAVLAGSNSLAHNFEPARSTGDPTRRQGKAPVGEANRGCCFPYAAKRGSLMIGRERPPQPSDEPQAVIFAERLRVVETFVDVRHRQSSVNTDRVQADSTHRPK